jgi:hypothetical protein
MPLIMAITPTIKPARRKRAKNRVMNLGENRMGR